MCGAKSCIGSENHRVGGSWDNRLLLWGSRWGGLLGCDDYFAAPPNESYAAQDRYHFILEQADSVENVSQEYRDGCMLERNRRMVEAAGLLLAVYNGERRGGTAATVWYARKLNREVLVLNVADKEK